LKDLTATNKKYIFSHHGPDPDIKSLCFSYDNKNIIFIDANSKIRIAFITDYIEHCNLYDKMFPMTQSRQVQGIMIREMNNLIKIFSNESVNSVCFSLDDKYIIAICKDNNIQFYDSKNKTLFKLLEIRNDTQILNIDSKKFQQNYK